MPLRKAGYSIAAVVMTRNRQSSLTTAIEAISSQARVPDVIVVVDGGSREPVQDWLWAKVQTLPLVILRYECNVGPAAGRGAGLAWARDAGYDYVCFVDDDTVPRPEALATLCAVMEMSPDIGLLGLRGGTVLGGLIRHGQTRGGKSRRGPAEVSAVDFVLLDGALMRTSLVASVGLPRADFFIMMEDVEYPLRLKKAGHAIGLLHADLMQWRNEGSQRSDATTVWRGYYQARNHVRMALDLPMRRLLLGVAVRELHFLTRYVGRRGSWRRLRYRWAGVRDGVLGRMGRRVEPSSTGLCDE